MLDFAKLHGVETKIETFRMDQVNEAIDRLKSGKAQYRIILSNE